MKYTVESIVIRKEAIPILGALYTNIHGNVYISCTAKSRWDKNVEEWLLAKEILSVDNFDARHICWSNIEPDEDDIIQNFSRG